MFTVKQDVMAALIANHKRYGSPMAIFEWRRGPNGKWRWWSKSLPGVADYTYAGMVKHWRTVQPLAFASFQTMRYW